jgi:hypothetical protein
MFKAGGCPCTPLHPCASPAIFSLSPSLCLNKKENRGQKKGESERGKRKIGGNTRILKVLPLPLSLATAEQDWTPSIVMLSHLQKLMKHGFLSAAELETYWMPEDPTLPTSADGYMESFMAFYEWGFKAPPH